MGRLVYCVMRLVSLQANINKSTLIPMSNYARLVNQRNQSISFFLVKKAIVAAEFQVLDDM